MAVEWNPFDPATREDPYPVYARLRAEAPVHRNPWGSYVVSRHADCVAALVDPRLGNDPRGGDDHRRVLEEGPPSVADQYERAGFMFRDPPDHGRLRGAIARHFTPARVLDHEPAVRTIVTGFVEEVAKHGGVDVVNELGTAVPTAVIASLLGVPTADVRELLGWRAVSVQAKQESASAPDAWDRRKDARDHILAILSRLVQERSPVAEPSCVLDSLAVAVADERPGQITLLDAALIADQLFVAGIESTAFLLGNAVAACVTTGRWRDLADGRLDAAAIVTETLRWDGATQAVGRFAHEDLEIGGDLVPAGAQVIVLLGSANRDPDRFVDPDRFAPDRDATHPGDAHALDDGLAFGHGRHRCVGAHLARLQAGIVLEALAARCPDLELVRGPDGSLPPHRPHMMLRGYAELPVTTGAAGGGR